ncbi:MAG: hypothetical protein J5879_04755 [Clostridia bacterium]|nr:hypothetical protein [Clostridia bacterium]
MKNALRIVSALVAAVMTLSAVCIVSVSAKEDAYAAELVEKGFPRDYADKLAALHKRHPNWSFEPLNVTQMSGGKYTWSYVIYMETDQNPKRSLVYNSDTYKNWRHPSNQQYDSGWWRASVETVEYFMDPRNFMNDEQIFQFYDLKWSDSITLNAVKAVVKGTFMENKKLDGKYSNLTYAEYFYNIGKELGVSPVYLAARVRAEQGTAGTSPLINGNVGDMLWYYYSNRMTGKDSAGHIINAPTSGYTEAQLKSYNGYYNYFNIGSAGTGYFEIYKNGITEAKTGTPDKKSEWGGDASWNMHWKSIYGGAYAATNKYVNDYQNTPYFQKFNVDPRSSRNFWGQYMQSITGSVGMATQSYNTFVENNMVELPYTFLIPVYEGMPDYCPHPDVIVSTEPAAIINSCIDSQSFTKKILTSAGWIGGNYEINRLGYSVDGGETVWSGVDIVPLDLSQEGDAAVVSLAGRYAVRYSAEIDDDALKTGDHSVMIMAEFNDAGRTVLKALMTSDGKEKPLETKDVPAKVTNSYIDRENDSADGRELCFFTDESESTWYIKGWFGVNYKALAVGYSFDRGPIVFDDSITMTRDKGLDPHTEGGKGYRFEANINTNKLSVGEHVLTIFVKVDDGLETQLNALRTRVIEIKKTKEPVRTPGDISGDGKVNNKDVVTLFKYVSGLDVYVDTDTVDVNGDGKLNNKDVVLLFKYVSGENVTIH